MEELTKDNAMMVLRPAAILLVCRVRALAGVGIMRCEEACARWRWTLKRVTLIV